MLISVAIKNYKVYKNIHLVPISNGSLFSAFLGANGVGKSSIFEALDSFFNGSSWNLNHDSKKDDQPFVAPLFLIEKSKIRLSAEEKALASLISDFYWDYDSNPYSDFIKSISSTTRELKAQGFDKSTHFLLLVGLNQEGFRHIPFYENELEHAIEESLTSDISHFDSLIKKIKSHYRYIYLPAEADTNTFSKIESNYVEKLLDENIKATIKSAISSDSIKSINRHLQTFISDINTNLTNYDYKGKRKDQLTTSDLVDRILSAFFGIKILHKKEGSKLIPVSNLSSGEKRRALVDLATALISRSPNRSYQIVLAIDEPDASIHISACHDHFEKISKIPHLTEPGPQVLINTHWYGFLPMIQAGHAHSLHRNDADIEFYSFNLENFRENINQKFKSSKGERPKEVELKSYQDMIQSVVIGMMRKKPYNWIFCEGLSDKIYLDHYLHSLTTSHNLRIIPVGGFVSVRRIYSYLSAPLGDRQAKFHGRAICLVDTDAQRESVDLTPSAKNLYFKRLTHNPTISSVELVDIDNQLSTPTEIEHTLNGQAFELLINSPKYQKSIKNFNLLKDVFESTQIIRDSTNLYNYLNLTPRLERDFQNFLDTDKNKVEFAKSYVACDPDREFEPTWMDSIRKLIVGGESTKK